MRVRSSALAPILAAIAAPAVLAACAAAGAAVQYAGVDLRPPGLVSACPTGAHSVLVRFDEEVKAVAGSLESRPAASLSAEASGQELLVEFAADQSPGADYDLAGEVDDLSGNRTRFLLRFTGWNDRAPPLRISEVQTCRNDSTTRPHRDFVELQVLADGNLGGEELCWASSVKSSTYRFPGIEARKGDVVVLHLAPQGLESERDELGSDLGLSGGIDSSASARDLWCSDSPLPDESGLISLSLRPGAAPLDGLFYADPAKSGEIADQDFASRVAALAAAGAWPLAGAKPAWSDAFAWKASGARSICRLAGAAAAGPSSWYLCTSGAQSPGAPNLAPGAAPSAAGKAGSVAAAGAANTPAVAAPRPTAKPGKKRAKGDTPVKDPSGAAKRKSVKKTGKKKGREPGPQERGGDPATL